MSFQQGSFNSEFVQCGMSCGNIFVHLINSCLYNVAENGVII